MKTLLAFTLVALGGCAASAGPVEIDHTPHPAYVYDPAKCAGHWHVDRATFDADTLAAIDASPAALARFTGRDALTLDAMPGDSCTIRATLSSALPDDTDFVGQYDRGTGNITIVSDWVPACEGLTFGRCTGPVILHEILHGLGVGHVTGSGIMNAHVMAPFFSKEDHEVCVTEGACVAP